jgi:hypothetical protein
MTKRFEKAYNALYSAFMNDTLAKGSCVACAVGNIVADAMGGKVSYNSDIYDWQCDLENAWWSDMFVTCDTEQRIIKIKENFEVKYLRKEIYTLTGYKWHELAKVEKAFEKNTEICCWNYRSYTEKEILEDQFNGLMAVMDVLIELDEVKEGEKYKDAFKSKLEIENKQ